jgi:hypothetical protein
LICKWRSRPIDIGIVISGLSGVEACYELVGESQTSSF